MHRKYVYVAQAYDESFEPMDDQDLDVIKRLQRFCLNYASFSNPEYPRVIPNTKTASVKCRHSGFPWEQLDGLNACASRLNQYSNDY